MIIPVIRCRRIADTIDFYTGILDFDCAFVSSRDDPAYAVLMRGASELHLSSHAGDGCVGQAVAILVEDVDALFRMAAGRGLELPSRPDSPVHQAPLFQTWGTREFYIDDPDGNTLRFIQR